MSSYNPTYKNNFVIVVQRIRLLEEGCYANVCIHNVLSFLKHMDVPVTNILMSYIPKLAISGFIHMSVHSYMQLCTSKQSTFLYELTTKRLILFIYLFISFFLCFQCFHSSNIQSISHGMCNVYASSYGDKFWMSLSGGWDGTHCRGCFANWQVGPPCPLFTK